MSIGPVWGPSLRTSPPALDLEALRIGAAMEHIEAHGNLDRFPARRGERLALVSTAVKQGLLVWNRSRGRYELTSHGHRRVRALRRAGRKALRDPQGGAVRSGMNAVVAAAGAVVVLGAAFLAFNPAGSTDSVPAREPGAYFAGGAAAPAVQATQPRAEVQPRAVTAAAVTDSRQVSSDQVSLVSPSRRADASGADARIQGAETARSLAAAVPSEPEIATGAAAVPAAPAAPAAPAQKSTADGRDRPETSKLAPTHKRSARRGPETVGPGYAYAPYGGTPGYRHWSASPWWFR